MIRSAEISGSFNFLVEDFPEVLTDELRRDLVFTVEYNWSRWDRFLNWFARVYFWPVGPYKLTKSYEWVLYNMKLNQVDSEDGVVQVNFES